MTKQNLQDPRLPADFIWGVSTAAYQIEGAANTNGRGPSIWDTFCRTPGKVKNADNGDVACDHYHKYNEDLDLIAESGVDVYRFSISWSRLLTTGTGAINPEGVAFYRNLLTGMKERGITPFVTLFHWDLPQPLQDAGGWPNRDTVDKFVNYVGVVSDQLGDLIDNYIVLNEPSFFAYTGHYQGVHAPGLTDINAFFATMHHLNLAHGRSTKLLKEKQPDAKVGSTYTHFPIYALDKTPESHAAKELLEASLSYGYFEPLFNGAYPQIIQHYVDPYIQPGDLADCNQPGDFLGVNYYCPDYATPSDEPLGAKLTFSHNAGEIDPEGTTDLGWPIVPQALYGALMDLNTRYKPKDILITEQGCAYHDTVSEDGKVHDPKRIEYYQKHLNAVADAIEDGVPVRGCFAWSLMDNFEWAEGYGPRFGLIYIDYESPERTRILKDSFHWYKALITKTRQQNERHLPATKPAVAI